MDNRVGDPREADKAERDRDRVSESLGAVHRSTLLLPKSAEAGEESAAQMSRQDWATREARDKSLRSGLHPTFILISSVLCGEYAVPEGLSAVENAIALTFQRVVLGWAGTPGMNVSPEQVGVILAVFCNLLREDPTYDLRMGSWLRDIADQAIALVDAP